jgi:hypothetical protein
MLAMLTNFVIPNELKGTESKKSAHPKVLDTQVLAHTLLE